MKYLLDEIYGINIDSFVCLCKLLFILFEYMKNDGNILNDCKVI